MTIFPATNLIPVSLHQLAYIINQRGASEVVVCGLRQSGRTGITRVLAELLSYHNPLWEAVAPEEPIGLTSAESVQKLEVMELGKILEVRPVSVIGSSGFSVRQGELREALEPLPENTLRIMIETRTPPGDNKCGNTALFVTIDGLCYYTGVGYDRHEEVPRYVIQGVPTRMGVSVLEQDLRGSERKNDLEMFFVYLHAGFVQQLNLTLFGGGADWPDDAKVEELPKEMPVEWREHILARNTPHPVYDAIRHAKKKPIPFQITGHSAKKVNEVAAMLSDMAKLNLHPQPLKDDGYVVQKVVMGSHPQYSAFVRYVNPKDAKDTYEHIFVSSPNELAVYQAAQLASNRLSVMLEMPRKLFGQDVLTIGSL